LPASKKKGHGHETAGRGTRGRPVAGERPQKASPLGKKNRMAPSRAAAHGGRLKSLDKRRKVGKLLLLLISPEGGKVGKKRGVAGTTGETPTQGRKEGPWGAARQGGGGKIIYAKKTYFHSKKNQHQEKTPIRMT